MTSLENFSLFSPFLHTLLLRIAHSTRDVPHILTSAAAFLREKVRSTSLGVEKDEGAAVGALLSFVVVAIAAAACFAFTFSSLDVSSKRADAGVAALATSAALPRRGGMAPLEVGGRGREGKRRKGKKKKRDEKMKKKLFLFFFFSHFEEKKTT